MKTRKKYLFNLTTVLLLVFGTVQAQEKVTIVAAANLKIALDSINTVFKIQNPSINSQITYGASGKLFEQISNSAPFDIFFSADMDYPKKLEEKNINTPIKLIIFWQKVRKEMLQTIIFLTKMIS